MGILNEFVDSLVSEIKAWNNDASGGNHYFGNAGAERIYGEIHDTAAINAVGATHPSIFTLFVSKTGGIADAGAAHSGSQYRYPAVFNARILLVWGGTGDKGKTIRFARDHAASLGKWLEESDVDGFSDIISLVKGISMFIPEEITAETGSVGVQIDFECHRDVGINIK